MAMLISFIISLILNAIGVSFYFDIPFVEVFSYPYTTLNVFIIVICVLILTLLIRFAGDAVADGGIDFCD